MAMATERSAQQKLDDLLGDKDPDYVVIRRDLYHHVKPAIEQWAEYLARRDVADGE